MLPEVVARCIRLHKSAAIGAFGGSDAGVAAAEEEKLHAGVPLPVIGCMVRRAPLRSHAPQTLLASIDTPSAIAFGSS